MNVRTNTIKLGLERGWIEFKHTLTSSQDLTWNLTVTAILVAVLWFMRNGEIEGIQRAFLVLPGLMGMTIASGGLMGVAGTLSYEREDGTLLRAKATPQGMVGYLISRVVYIVLTTFVSLVLLFVPALFFVDGLLSLGIGGALFFTALFFLGLLSTAPIGAAIGALVKTSGSGFGITFLVLGGLTAISGIFYPITAMAGWVQTIGQIFPVYWLGHGMRYVFLPEEAAVAELGNVWQPGVAVVVLLAWSVVGMLFAPRLLRKMARKVSGSEMQSRKEEMLNRGY